MGKYGGSKTSPVVAFRARPQVAEDHGVARRIQSEQGFENSAGRELIDGWNILQGRQQPRASLGIDHEQVQQGALHRLSWLPRLLQRLFTRLPSAPLQALAPGP